MSNTLLGGAIGDALGMPFEKKLANDPYLINWDGLTFLSSEQHQLQAGQWTDDSEMQQMVALSLVENQGLKPEDLASRYLDWFFSGRARGYGRTTKLAMQNLQSGKHWSESGIADSLGNGSAMRAAPFGIYFRHNIQDIISACRIDSTITHASAEAEAGSIAIGLAAGYAVNNDLDHLLEKIWVHLPESKVKTVIYSLSAMLDNESISSSQVLRVLGTKADVRETVPAALYCFLKFNNHQDGIVAAIKAGGDTDTTASIVGALFGAKDGFRGMNANLALNVEGSSNLIKLDSQLYNRSNSEFFPNNLSNY